jgi:UDP-perosamine 4-acetyltransferase
MDSQSSYNPTDEVKLISNILREPASRSGGESRETTAEILSEPASALASHSKNEPSEMAAESNTTPAGNGAEPQRASTDTSGVRGALWRFLVLCVQPIFSRLRDYLLGPVHAKFDAHATESRDAIGRIQLQVQVIRADLDVLPKQIVHLEFQVRNFANQLTHLESQFDFLTEQLKHFESRADSVNSEAVVIVGSGGHAKVVIEQIRSEGKYQIKGCTAPGETGFVLGDVPILGTDNVLPAVLANGAKKAFVALGDNHLRLRLLAKVSEMGFELINAVSPNAVISPSVSLGRGIAIMAGAIINASTEIGDGAIINTNAGVDHDCRIGKGAHIGPGSALAGRVEIGCESFLGAGTRVVPGVRIGSRVVVGAGSVVVRDIPDDVIAMGVPARVTAAVKTPAKDLSD